MFDSFSCNIFSSLWLSPGFFGQRQMQYQGYPPHPPTHPANRFNRPFDQQPNPPQGLQTCPPQIGSRPAFTFPSTTTSSSKNLDEDSNFESGRSSSYRQIL